MQVEPIGARGGAVEMVVVTRGWGDGRTVVLPVGVLSGWHMAVEERGRRRWLPRPVLAAYVDGAVLDAAIAEQGVAFGRTGSHDDGGAGRPQVLIRRGDNPPGLYGRLRAEGERRRHTRARAERMRARAARRRAQRSGS
jgi:hypothetical protein